MMANITLTVEDRLLQRARDVAASMGTTLNGLVRSYLRQIADGSSPSETSREFRELSFEHQGGSNGWSFDRDEIHER
jgi:hypothetical protein